MRRIYRFEVTYFWYSTYPVELIYFEVIEVAVPLAIRGVLMTISDLSPVTRC